MYVHVIYNEFCTYVEIVAVCTILNSTEKICTLYFPIQRTARNWRNYYRLCSV